MRAHVAPQTEVVEPAGGCALWIRLPEHIGYARFFQRAVDANILIFPGRAFSADERYRNCLRISTGAPLAAPPNASPSRPWAGWRRSTCSIGKRAAIP